MDLNVFDKFITIAELIKQLKDRGYHVTRESLAKWHKQKVFVAPYILPTAKGMEKLYVKDDVDRLERFLEKRWLGHKTYDPAFLGRSKRNYIKKLTEENNKTDSE